MRHSLSVFNPLLGVNIVREHRDLLVQMLLRGIASRYRGSALGFIWSFAHPLVMLGVYTFVFGIVFKARWGVDVLEGNRAAFPLIMFCGMAVFNIFSESVNASTGAVVGNPSYVKKVVFPLELLPICNVLTGMVFGMAWFALLLVGMLVFFHYIPPTVFLLPLILVPLLFFTAGISFFTASLGVYLRDMQQLVGIITQILFFMTPIFYPIAVVPERLRWVLRLNPLSSLVEQARQVVLYGQLPDLAHFLLLLAVSLLVFQFGLAWFVKTKKGFADVM